MSAKHDLESFCDSILAIMRAGLNNKITALNTEKNDSVVLAQIDNDAYFWQTLDGPTINANPYVFYGVSDIGSGSNGMYSNTAMIPEILVAIVLSDMAKDVNITRRMFRYGRALQEVFEEGFASDQGGVRISVKSLVPIEPQLLNDEHRTDRAIGVLISAEMG